MVRSRGRRGCDRGGEGKDGRRRLRALAGQAAGGADPAPTRRLARYFTPVFGLKPVGLCIELASAEFERVDGPRVGDGIDEPAAAGRVLAELGAGLTIHGV